MPQTIEFCQGSRKSVLDLSYTAQCGSTVAMFTALPGGVIGNTDGFGPAIQGSSPCRVVFLSLRPFLAAVGGEPISPTTFAI